MRFNEYKFRAHSVGHIIDVPKPLTDRQKETLESYKSRETGNGKPLTDAQKKDLVSLLNKYNESQVYQLRDSTKKELSKLAFAHTYGRTVMLNSPQVTKGLEVEKQGRDILSRVSGLFLTSCEERKTNDWVTGKIDIEPNDVIVDIKSSYSWVSFSELILEKPNEIYLRQGDCYMDLWEKKEFLLCHVLTDTPSHLVESEVRKLDYKKNILSMDGYVRDECIEDVVQLVCNHIFSSKSLESFCENSSFAEISWFSDFIEIPESKRVHMVSHQFDIVRIEQRNECIKLSREFMNTCEPINNFNPKLLQ